MKDNLDFYPKAANLQCVKENEHTPQTLRLLLSEIYKSDDRDLEMASIGQSIMQQTRPRTLLAPLQYGLAVQMYHHFGSRFLIDNLNSHGYCL